jgi:hypothetical protein
MSSFLFYDPNNHHATSQLDLGIVYIQHINILRHLIATSNNFQQVVFICSADKSSVIEEIKDKQHIVSIYLCNNNDHGGPEPDSVLSLTKCNHILVTPNSGWEFKGRLALLDACIKREYMAQGLKELQRVRQLERQFLFTPQQSTESFEY